MRIALAIAAAVILAAIAVGVWTGADNMVDWAVAMQRTFQNEMAAAVRAIQSGDAGAWGALLFGAGAYGFVHAVGPGHGKYLIGGAGLGTGVSAQRLLGLSVVSSLAQSLWAIALVYGGFSALELTAQSMTNLAEDYLAPASYAAIAGIGGLFMWRGGRALARLRKTEGQTAHDHHHNHPHDDHCGCSHSHGPTPVEAAGLNSVRDAILLVGSIAIRPCTGAIFLLVIAWQLDINLAGAIAVMVMGLGTAGLTGLVAISSVAARGLAVFSSDGLGIWSLARPSLELAAGAVIIWISCISILRVI